AEVATVAALADEAAGTIIRPPRTAAVRAAPSQWPFWPPLLFSRTRLTREVFLVTRTSMPDSAGEPLMMRWRTSPPRSWGLPGPHTPAMVPLPVWNRARFGAVAGAIVPAMAPERVRSGARDGYYAGRESDTWGCQG